MKVKISESNLTDIADSIRSNLGVQTQYKPSEMSSAIDNISKGADVSGVTATAGDVDTGKVFVDSTGQEVTGNSTYKSDYTALNTLVGQTTATASDVSKGKVFLNSSGIQTTGTHTNIDITQETKEVISGNFSSTFTVPEGVTVIGGHKFQNNTTIKTVNIPSSVTKLNEYAFYGCSNLTNIDISNITSMEKYVFYGCNNLILNELPLGLQGELGGGTFNSCSKITISYIPNGVTSVGLYTFKDCVGITSLTFLSKPSQISSIAFSGCTNLRTINVPWSKNQVAYSPWGATNATIVYNYTP